MANQYGVQDSVWNVLTPEEKSYVAQGNQTMLSSLGSTYSGNQSAPAQVQQPQIPQMPQFQPYNPAAEIEAFKKATIANNAIALDKQRQSTMGALEKEKKTIEPAYQKQKIQAGVTAQKQARSFEEYMAQRGGGAAKSGIGAQGMLMNQNALQRNMGELNTAEANALTSNAQRMTDTETAYQADIAANEQGANTQAMAMQIQANQQAAAAEQAYQQWLYGQQQSQAQNQFSQQMQLAGLTGILPQAYGGGQTLAAQQQAIENKRREQELALARQKATQPAQPEIDKNLAFAQEISDISVMQDQGRTKNEILAEIQRKAPQLSMAGVDVLKLYEWVNKNVVDTPKWNSIYKNLYGG